jgi:hypothetical protein
MDVIQKLETRTSGKGFHPNYAIAILASAAGLPFKLALDIIGFPFDGFPVGNTGFFQYGFHPEFGFGFFQQDIQMHFTHAGNQELVHFSIPTGGQGRVFFNQPMDSGCNLIFIAFGLSFKPEE